MPNTRARAGPLMGAGVLSFLASRFLARADQVVFGLPSDFLGGFVLAIGLGAFTTGLALAVTARRSGKS